MKTDQSQRTQTERKEKAKETNVNNVPTSVDNSKVHQQYEIENDGQKGLEGEAEEKQDRAGRVNYDRNNLSDGGTWGAVSSPSRSSSGFGL